MNKLQAHERIRCIDNSIPRLKSQFKYVEVGKLTAERKDLVSQYGEPVKSSFNGIFNDEMSGADMFDALFGDKK